MDFNVGIIIVNITDKDVEFTSKTTSEMSTYAIIGKTKGRYELLGVDKGQSQIQTLFDNTDGIMRSLDAVKIFNLVWKIINDNKASYESRENIDDIKVNMREMKNTMYEISKGVDKKSEFDQIYSNLYSMIG